MTDDIIPIMACPPVDASVYTKYGLPLWHPREGFTVTTCELCKQQVWIGPRQRAKRQAEGCEVQCWVCAVKNGSEVRNLGG